MIEEVPRGQPLRLNLQLSDGEESLPRIVKAFLRDGYGAILSDYPNGVALSHVGLGLFKNKSVLMPMSVSEVTSQYVVYQQDGVTVDTEYIYSYDKFVPVDLDESGADSANKADDMLAVDFDDNSVEIEVADIKDTDTIASVEQIETILSDDDNDIIVIIQDDEDV
jgi:hypothetical protein